MLGQLILPLINTPLLLLTLWIPSSNQHSWYLYLPSLLVIHKPSIREGWNLHLKQYGFDTVGKIYSPRLQLAWCVCVNCALDTCLAHLCFVWNSSVSPELKAACVRPNILPPCHCCFTAGSFQQEVQTRAPAIYLLSLCLSEGFASIHYMLGCW